MKIEEAIKQNKFESSQHKLFVNILYTYHWLMDIQESVFNEFDLTPQQYNVLRILKGRFPNSCCVGDVKEVMIDKNPDLTRLCDRLLKKGLIERQPNEFNRRQVLIKITPTGLDFLKTLNPKLKKLSKQILLSEQEAEKMSDMLDKLRG